jgi:hypothetical protein
MNITVPQPIFKPRVRRPQYQKEQAKIKAATMIRAQGYRVNLGKQGYSCLWVTDGTRVACVEVRRAKFTAHKARHQASVKTTQPVDLLILMLRDPATAGHDYPFILPLSAIGERYNVSIWEANPANYCGQWAKYLQAWEHLHQVVSQATPRAPWHLSLFR